MTMERELFIEAFDRTMDGMTYDEIRTLCVATYEMYLTATAEIEQLNCPKKEPQLPNFSRLPVGESPQILPTPPRVALVPCAPQVNGVQIVEFTELEAQILEYAAVHRAVKENPVPVDLLEQVFNGSLEYTLSSLKKKGAIVMSAGKISVSPLIKFDLQPEA